MVIGSFAENTKQFQLLKRMVERGHELGNHMYKDRRYDNDKAADFERVLLQTEDIIRSQVEEFPGSGLIKWYRPPSGMISCGQTSILQQKYHYKLALGDVYNFDGNMTNQK